MRESEFQSGIVSEIRERLPGSIILKNDSKYVQGIPDWIILWNERWAALECKASSKAPKRPNQHYYVDLMDQMSFAAFIYPENRQEVLDDLERTFKGHS